MVVIRTSETTSNGQAEDVVQNSIQQHQHHFDLSGCRDGGCTNQDVQDEEEEEEETSNSCILNCFRALLNAVFRRKKGSSKDSTKITMKFIFPLTPRIYVNLIGPNGKASRIAMIPDTGCDITCEKPFFVTYGLLHHIFLLLILYQLLCRSASGHF
jgi:hypothetical protein